MKLSIYQLSQGGYQANFLLTTAEVQYGVSGLKAKPKFITSGTIGGGLTIYLAESGLALKDRPGGSVARCSVGQLAMQRKSMRAMELEYELITYLGRPAWKLRPYLELSESQRQVNAPRPEPAGPFNPIPDLRVSHQRNLATELGVKPQPLAVATRPNSTPLVVPPIVEHTTVTVEPTPAPVTKAEPTPKKRLQDIKDALDLLNMAIQESRDLIKEVTVDDDLVVHVRGKRVVEEDFEL